MHNQKTLAETIELKIRENSPGSQCLLVVPPATNEIEHLPAENIKTEYIETETIETENHPVEQITQNNKGIHLPSNFNTTWPHTRTNQVINVIYFGTSAAFFQWLSSYAPGAVSPVFSPVLLILAALSCVFLVKYRTCISTNDELPRWTQNALRGLALLFPTFAFCAMLLMCRTIGVPIPSEAHNLPPIVAERIEPVITIEPAIPAGPIDEAALQRELDIGEALLKKGQHRNAIIHFDKALAMDPKCEWALTRLAECWYEGDRWKPEKSIEYGNRAIAINPESIDAHYYLAKSYNTLDRYSLAVPHAQFITTKVPDSGPNWSMLVASELGAGHLEAALKAANAHVKLHPNEWKSLDDRAGVFKAMGRTQEEKADRERLKKL